MPNLVGKNAFVTGGSRGIGAAIVRKLASEGARVAFTYNNSVEKANELVNELKKFGAEVQAIKADNSHPSELIVAVNQVAASWGNLDILVNNAGILVGGRLDAADQKLTEYERQIDTNIRSIPVLMKAASKVFNDFGRIVFMGSIAGSAVGNPFLTDYAATKAAVAAYGRGYALDLGSRGITVNTVQPGPVATDMNPTEGEFADYFRNQTALKRFATVEEIAALVGFLVSQDAGFITGASINIDGGMLA